MTTVVQMVRVVFLVPVLVTASLLVKMVILIRMMLAVTVLWILTYGEESVMTGSVVFVKMSMRQPPRGHFFEFARKPSQARSGRDSRAQAEGSIKNALTRETGSRFRPPPEAEIPKLLKTKLVARS